MPWVLFGAVLGAAALIALAGAPNVAVMTLLWCLVQAGCNGAYAAITAAIPDRVPVPQRGTVGGLAAMGQTVGILVGAVIAAAVTGNFAAGYLVCAAALLAGVVLYFFKNDDVPLPAQARPPFSLAGFVRGFWISPARYPDFAWAWLTRLLVNIGNHMVTLYLLFFLDDAVRVRETQGIEPEFGVLILTGPVCGHGDHHQRDRRPAERPDGQAEAAGHHLLRHDRRGLPDPCLRPDLAGCADRRRPCWASASAATWRWTSPSSPRCCPRPLNRGKDLGVINIANSLPQVLAPLIAFPFVTLLGRLCLAVRGGRRDWASGGRVRGEDQGRGLSRRVPSGGSGAPVDSPDARIRGV